MRLMLAIGLCGVLAAFLSQEEEQKKPRGIPGYRQAEQERLEEEVLGTWALVEYRNPREVLERSHYSGFASFQNGYFTLILRFEVLETSFFGPRPQMIFRAGTHQYRVTGDGRLQTATVLAFSNETPLYEIEVEPGALPREYQLLVDDGQLTLRRWDGVELVFRRAEGAGTFPQRAADALERYRGREFTPPPDWGRKR